MTQPTDSEEKPSPVDDTDDESARRAAATAERARQVAERASESLRAERERRQKKRRWYHWVIDIVLFVAVVYLIKTRFFSDKSKQVPVPPSDGSPSALSSAGSAPGSRVVVNPTSVLQGPGYHFALVELLHDATRAEVVAPPETGWVKIRLGPSREGWVRVEAIFNPARRAPVDGGARD